ncbi:hypothetical protein Tco_0289646 [Tanacetum coccineum]
MIRLRAETPSTSHLLPLPTSSPPLLLLSSDHRTDMPEITLPPRKRLGIDLGPSTRLERVFSYSFHLDPKLEVVWQTMVPTNETARLLDQEGSGFPRGWDVSIEVTYMIRLDIMALRFVVMGQQAVISQLQAAGRRSQVVTLEMLQVSSPKPSQTLIPLHSVTNAQLQTMINEGVTAALAAHDATRNGDESHTSGTGARRPVQVARQIATFTLGKEMLLHGGTTHVKNTTPELPINARVRYRWVIPSQLYPRTGTNVRSDDSGRNRQKLRDMSLRHAYTNHVHVIGILKKEQNYAGSIEFFATDLMDKKQHLGMNGQADNKRNLMTPPVNNHRINNTQETNY